MSKADDPDREEEISLQQNLLDNRETNATATNNTAPANNPNEPPAPPKAKHLKKSFRRLMGYTMKHRVLVVCANIGMLITALGMVILPYLCGLMIDDIKNERSLTVHAIQLGILSVLLAVFSAIRGYCFNVLGEKVMLDLRIDLFQKLVGKDVAYYDANKSGELISRLTSDVNVVQSAASDNLSLLLRSIVQFLGSIIFLWTISWELTLFIVVATPIFSVFILLLIRQMKRLKKVYQDSMAKANSLANEVFGNIRVVKSFATETKELTRFTLLMKQVFRVGLKEAWLYAAMLALMMVFANGLVLSILYFGGSLVIHGKLTIGFLTSYVLYTITMTVGLTSAAGILNQIISAIGVVQRIFEIMDTQVTVTSGSHTLEASNKLHKVIEFKDVVFSYPSKTEVKVLKNINLNIFNGESVAIVGSSGSGKSSLVNLLMRFYDVQSGEIEYFGDSIKNYQLDSIRRGIGYVSQEPTLFSGTLRENVIYGLEAGNVTEAEVEKALEIANAKSFVHNRSMFPQGLESIVGERGIKLSGGQKQRIAIARCVIKNPKILIFDEATSALDAESEYNVQQAIDGLLSQKDRTIIIIAHRLSTVINCDRIVVLDQGLIAEQGKHHDLLKIDNGVYRRLFDRQITGTSDSNAS